MVVVQLARLATRWVVSLRYTDGLPCLAESGTGVINRGLGGGDVLTLFQEFERCRFTRCTCIHLSVSFSGLNLDTPPRRLDIIIYIYIKAPRFVYVCKLDALKSCA